MSDSESRSASGRPEQGPHETRDTGTNARQRWMAVLAKARPEELEASWTQLRDRPAYQFVRRPEVGLTMVRARAGATGMPFNLGEMTVTRCAVQIGDGPVGFGYVGGRSTRQAELAAVFDAMLQNTQWSDEVSRTVVSPLAAEQQARRAERAAEAAETRVEFFTLVRGQ